MTSVVEDKNSSEKMKKSRPIGKILCGLVFSGLLIGGLIATIVYYNLQPVPRQYQWWHKTTIYQIYPRSFQDSNGDGVGDLNGITERLPYLKTLGIETIWLSPIFKSPMRDFGYDIQNFTEIDPLFGIMFDFDTMINKTKELNLRVVLDFVPNHSSDLCEWFLKSVADRAGEYGDFYVWHDGHPLKQVTYTMANGMTKVIKAPPNNWLSVFGGSAWEWNPTRNQYYLHQFLASQPDLNWFNPQVEKTMNDVLTFWLNRGIDGFRIDAIPHLFEIPLDEMVDADETLRSPYAAPDLPESDHDYWLHTYTKNMDPTIQQVHNWTRLMTEYTAQNGGDSKFLILEVVDKNVSEVRRYYPEDPFVTAAMPFYMGLVFMNETTDGYEIDRMVRANLEMLPTGAWPNWVIGNHDQHRATTRLGAGDFIDGLNMLNLLLPGIPTTYYGEEIGMRNTILRREDVQDPQALHPSLPPGAWEKKTRDYNRSPMQWNTSTSAGFSSNPKTWLPLAPGWDTTINVEYQSNVEYNPTHYSIFRDLIRIRRTPAFQSGQMRSAIVNHDIYSFVRELADQQYLIAIDLRRETEGVGLQEYDFTPAKVSGVGRVVTASANLFSKSGAEITPGTIASFGKDKPIDLRRVPLMPASAVVLRLADK